MNSEIRDARCAPEGALILGIDVEDPIRAHCIEQRGVMACHHGVARLGLAMLAGAGLA
jgi:hypothetical protein